MISVQIFDRFVRTTESIATKALETRNDPNAWSITKFFYPRVYCAGIGAAQVTAQALRNPAVCLENLCGAVANVGGRSISLIASIFRVNILTGYSLKTGWVKLNHAAEALGVSCVYLPLWLINCPLAIVVRFFSPETNLFDVLPEAKPLPETEESKPIPVVDGENRPIGSFWIVATTQPALDFGMDRVNEGLSAHNAKNPQTPQTPLTERRKR